MSRALPEAAAPRVPADGAYRRAWCARTAQVCGMTTSSVQLKQAMVLLLKVVSDPKVACTAIRLGKGVALTAVHQAQLHQRPTQSA